MNTLSKPSNSKRLKFKRVKKRRLNPKDKTPLVAIASFLGFAGLIANSLLTGNIAYFGIRLGLAGGIQGWFLGLFTIFVSLLSTLTGLGVIFIPRQTLAAMRLMGLAGLGSLMAGLLLLWVGINLLALAGIAMLCFGLSAIALYILRRQRLRAQLKTSRSLVVK